MTKLEKLPPLKAKSKKRRGRGYGSGKGGHTAGRGAKGHKARGKVPLTFEGTKTKKSLIRRLPLQRGKGKFKSLQTKPLIINLEVLNLLPKNSLVTLDLLAKHNIVKLKEVSKTGVKILGGGKLSVALKVQLPCSKGAVEKIKKAGGQVLDLKPTKKAAPAKPKPKAKTKPKPKAKAKAQAKPQPKAKKTKTK